MVFSLFLKIHGQSQDPILLHTKMANCSCWMSKLAMARLGFLRKKLSSFLEGSSEVKRPLMSDVEIKQEFDAVDVTLTTRYSPVVCCGEAICKITGLNTT